MNAETLPRAMGYVCVDLVTAIEPLLFQSQRIAARLGYDYIGMTRGSSLIVPEALIDHVATHEIELLIVPHIAHLRGRIPAELGEMTDIHDLATGRTYERGGGYAPEGGRRNPLDTSIPIERTGDKRTGLETINFQQPQSPGAHTGH
ncbi:hypothetical protein B7C42_08062 [Nocardia cerradoensis]|uniref:Uncharacterized protein n=1 Tax=Nocardia cerradoensis TaxID=85688 RepID=A0A231GTJ0_9NOCA|nr:hypothetical protein [Nocardia cerradoensis]OXR39865.1 hypothetical protein B7C42_08062 [Nocardia cerradoensis]